MLPETHPAPVTADLLGDLHPLIEQIGSPNGLSTLAAMAENFPVKRIASAADLRRFLAHYHSEILRPLELPAIQRGFHHASRNELRELLVFDRHLAGEPLLQSFITASRRVGQSQLERLRPLHDHRFVQRYLAAVNRNEAHGWHTLIYGLTLAVYSVPLRQGIYGYAQQATRGFIQAASRTISISDAEAAKILDEVTATLPETVEPLLAPLTIS